MSVPVRISLLLHHCIWRSHGWNCGAFDIEIAHAVWFFCFLLLSFSLYGKNFIHEYWLHGVMLSIILIDPRCSLLSTCHSNFFMDVFSESFEVKCIYFFIHKDGNSPFWMLSFYTQRWELTLPDAEFLVMSILFGGRPLVLYSFICADLSVSWVRFRRWITW